MTLETELGRFDLLFFHDVTKRRTTCQVLPSAMIAIDIDLPLNEGHAYCCHTDQFNRKVGRKVALTRALRPYPRAVRQAVWHAYWQSGQRP